jgi:hypothetical protein
MAGWVRSSFLPSEKVKMEKIEEILFIKED